MKRSTDRILTTHTGSLPRPPELFELLVGRDQREAETHPEFARLADQAVVEAVRQQVDAGIDIVSDGEMARTGFSTYITDRLTGFGDPAPIEISLVEAQEFPEFYGAFEEAFKGMTAPSCDAPIEWVGPERVSADIDRFRAATADMEPDTLFMNAISPGQVPCNFPSSYYKDDLAFAAGIADALHNEYKAVVDAGFILQIDAPDLAFAWGLGRYRDMSLEDYRSHIDRNIEIVNEALRDIPADRVRVHVCWGNAAGPHVRDVPLAEIIDSIYRLNAQGLSVEGSNPRHEHEWEVFKDHPLPQDKVLIPGVIDSTSNFVEHPDLVAQRIVRYANVVGKENLIASTDCGFGSVVVAGMGVHPTIAWAKLRSLTEGASRASEQLWRN